MREIKRRKSFSRGGTFFIGFFFGMLASVLIAIGLLSYFIRHPQRAMVKMVDMGVNRMVEKTVESVPREYIGQHQEEISESVQRFTQAFSQNRIDSDEMNQIIKKIFAAIADQKVTASEMDGLLLLANQLANS